MDAFQKVLIQEKNPENPELAEVMEARSASINSIVTSMAVPDPILQWAARMKLKDIFPTVMVGHLPCDHVTALMAVRYGQDTSQWPVAFSPEDYSRALAWEQGKIPSYVKWGQEKYNPLIAGGTELTDYMEAQIGNHMFRTELTVIAPWTLSTAVSVGDIRQAVVWNDTMFECVVAGTTGATEPTWNLGIGIETVDGGATWIAVKVGLPKRGHFIALYTAAPGEVGGGTEVSGGSYARVLHAPTDVNWNASVPAAGAGRNDNAVDITFPAPTANWLSVTDMAIMTRSTGGNMIMYSPLGTSKTVNNGDPAPKFAVGALDVDWS